MRCALWLWPVGCGLVAMDYGLHGLLGLCMGWWWAAVLCVMPSAVVCAQRPVPSP
jgi:hypothetical protein